jgi:hypothetical protein
MLIFHFPKGNTLKTIDKCLFAEVPDDSKSAQLVSSTPPGELKSKIAQALTKGWTPP